MAFTIYTPVIKKDLMPNIHTLILIALFSFISILSASKLTKNELKKFNAVLDRWNARVDGEMNFSDDLKFYNDTLSVVESKLPLLAKEPNTLRRVYSIAFKTFDNISVISEFISLRTPAIKLLSCLYGFARYLFNDEIFTEDEIFEFFIKASNRLFMDGYNGISFTYLLSYNFKSTEIITQLVIFCALYFKNYDDHILGIEPLLCFFFRFLKIAQDKELIVSIMNSCPEMAMECLQFIHNHKKEFSSFFREWNIAYFRHIAKIFHDEIEESKIRMFLDFGKNIWHESDLDWIVGIFSAKNIADYIYSKPLLLGYTLEILIDLEKNYPSRFSSCLGTLGPNQGANLITRMSEHASVKAHAFTALEIEKLLPRLQKKEGVSESVAYSDWETALRFMACLDVNFLTPEDRAATVEIVEKSFLKLFDEYSACSHDDESILVVLNCYIAVLCKMGNMSLDIYIKVVQIASLFADHLSRRFALKSDTDIKLNEIGLFLQDFRGEVFPDCEIAAFNLSKFVMFWKLNLFAMKVFIDFVTDLNWFTNDVIINNLIFRVNKFAMAPLNGGGWDEAEELKEIIFYFGNELQIISKTQMLALLRLIFFSMRP